MRFFLDNCMPFLHAKGMEVLSAADGHTFVHLREKFDEDAGDPIWLKALGTEGSWIVLSGDTRISRNPINRAAWHESKLTAFFFGEPWSNDHYWKKTAALLRWWPAIVLQAKKTPVGCGFLMPKSGKELKPIYPGR